VNKLLSLYFVAMFTCSYKLEDGGVVRDQTQVCHRYDVSIAYNFISGQSTCKNVGSMAISMKTFALIQLPVWKSFYYTCEYIDSTWEQTYCEVDLRCDLSVAKLCIKLLVS